MPYESIHHIISFGGLVDTPTSQSSIVHSFGLSFDLPTQKCIFITSLRSLQIFFFVNTLHNWDLIAYILYAYFNNINN